MVKVNIFPTALKRTGCNMVPGIFSKEGIQQVSRVFLAVSGLYTFLLPTLCLRFAYAVAVSAYAGLLCLDLPP